MPYHFSVLPFALRRLGQTALVVLGATLLLYAMVFVVPGDPIRALYGFRPPPPAELARLHDYYRLDEPFLVQYGSYLWRLLHGDLGTSYQGFGVRQAVRANAPGSLQLLGVALVAQLVLGTAAGALATLRRKTLGGALLTVSTLALTAMPVMVLAYLLQAVVGVRWGWLPTGGATAGWRSYLLPALTLSAVFSAYVARLTAASLRTQLHAEYLRLARAKGVSRARAIGVHAVRNAGVPVVTLTAGNIGHLLSGLIIVEGAFSLPGLGGAVFAAVQQKDVAVVVGIVTLFVLVAAVVTLFADLLCAAIDPRTALR